MKIKAIRGTRDILPNEAAIWSAIEEKAKRRCELYGYHQIRTPLLEETGLFTRSIGASSDIVRKEMYSFFDRKKRSLTLRPEGTASVVRAYLEHGLDKSLGLAKFYYLGPMFRAERPQAGRLRQFHHLGVEAIGSLSPYLDAEVISLAEGILQEIGIKNFTIQLNNIGCRNDRLNYKLMLKKELKNKLKSLCADCQNRYKINLLRIFDCKNANCKNITASLPAITAVLCPECVSHFRMLQQILAATHISFVLNPYLVRGLDYYSRSCFEIVHPDLGAQNALGAGGRYDDLVSELGGPERPAVGFALGLERLIAAIGPIKADAHNQASTYVYIAVIGEKAQQPAFTILSSLRKQGIQAEMNYLEQSLKGQMRQADKLGAKFVVMLGEEELNKQTVTLRDMHNKTQREIGWENLTEELK